eukprot:9498428-Pyramimonas_sp.AAC.1
MITESVAHLSWRAYQLDADLLAAQIDSHWRTAKCYIDAKIGSIIEAWKLTVLKSDSIASKCSGRGSLDSA